MSDLERRFEQARAAGDGKALALAFAEAAEQEGDDRARAFMLTQALALGLEAGLPECALWRERLIDLGAERSD